MRIVHLSDTHLGHRALTYVDDRGRNVREQDVYSVFRKTIEMIVEIRPDAVVHAGDLFDSWHPPTEALGAALDAVTRLREHGIPFVVIAGNHSTPRFRAAQHVFSLLERFGTTGADEEARTVHAIARTTQRVRVKDLTITAIPHTHERGSLEAAIAAAVPDPDARFNVLTFHAGVEMLPRLGAGEAASIEIDPKALESASGFDYVALGHFHSWQPVRRNAFYSGSLEVLSFAERDPKVIVEIDLARAEDDPLRIARHPVPQTRVVRELDEVDALDSDDLGQVVIEALGGIELDGAVIRCPIAGLTPDAYRSFDRAALNEVTAPCLHFELAPQFTPVAAAQAQGPDDLRAFLTAQTPSGLDPASVIARAEALLGDASTGLGA
jgi:DNA repair exonuclease SbcCD nuclease subunit